MTNSMEYINEILKNIKQNLEEESEEENDEEENLPHHACGRTDRGHHAPRAAAYRGGREAHDPRSRRGGKQRSAPARADLPRTHARERRGARRPKRTGPYGDIRAKERTYCHLHPKVSRSYGASTTEITDAHPENVELFLKIAETLDDPLVGVDFMMEDMARSWREQKCGVIECNSCPFIDLHHYPLRGPARNVAGMVWDMIFPSSAART